MPVQASACELVPNLLMYILYMSTVENCVGDDNWQVFIVDGQLHPLAVDAGEGRGPGKSTAERSTPTSLSFRSSASGLAAELEGNIEGVVRARAGRSARDPILCPPPFLRVSYDCHKRRGLAYAHRRETYD